MIIMVMKMIMITLLNIVGIVILNKEQGHCYIIIDLAVSRHALMPKKVWRQ